MAVQPNGAQCVLASIGRSLVDGERDLQSSFACPRWDAGAGRAAMNTVYVIVVSAIGALTFFSMALAKLVPDEYDHGALRLAPARSRAIRVRQ